MFELDKYTIKARLYPSFLVLVPLFITSVFYITNIEEYYHYFTAVIGIGLITFLLSQLGRDKGKTKEPELNEYLGGKPTTQILRHRSTYLDSFTKARYHKLLEEEIGNIKIPTSDEELQDEKLADQIYESCAKYLISKTRDIVKFKLLFKENISYGFRRNLWGMKAWALLILFACLILHLTFVTSYFKLFNQFSPADIGLGIYFGFSIIFWTIIITKDWVKIPAFAYAERLYESLNVLRDVK